MRVSLSPTLTGSPKQTSSFAICRNASKAFASLNSQIFITAASSVSTKCDALSAWPSKRNPTCLCSPAITAPLIVATSNLVLKRCRTLSAPEGVWAVLGNHDHYTDPELTTRALERQHIAVLNNAHTTIRRGPDSLQLSGIDDWSWNAVELGPRVLRPKRKDTDHLAFASTEQCSTWNRRSNVSLILSGHTHGGQLNFPLLGAPRVSPPKISSMRADCFAVARRSYTFRAARA